MKIKITFAVLFLNLFSMRSFAECSNQRADQWLWDLHRYDVQARKAGKDSAAKEIAATQGLDAASCCLNAFPGDTGCVFYRGVHRGWMLDARIKDVKSGLQSMKSDFVVALNQNPSFESGAPERALGNLYLNLPVLPIFGREFSRDLDLAQSYADRAMKIDPKHPENLQLMGELALKRGDKVKAAQYFDEGLKVLQVPKDLTELQRILYRDLSELAKKAK